MTERIAAGDLVQVVRGPVCQRAPRDYHVGMIFKVMSISSKGGGFCNWCGKGQSHDITCYAEGPAYWYDIRRLKRIPPLSELESLDHEHKLDVRQPA